MTFQSYLENIRAKTGKSPQDFVQLAQKKGFLQPGVKATEIVQWLKQDFGLGHGHAMAIVLVLKQAKSPTPRVDERIDKLFRGNRTAWRVPYLQLVAKVKRFGDDVEVDATDTYLSFLRGAKKFAALYVTSARLDIGVKLKGTPPAGRLEAAGMWSAMVTHRVRVADPKQIDAELISWLHRAYLQALKDDARATRA